MFKYLLQSVNHNNGFSGFWCFAIKIYISEARKLTQHVCLSRRLKFSSQEFTVLSLLFQGIRHPLLTSRGTRGHTKYTHPCKPNTQIQNTSLQKYNTHSNGQLRTPLPQLVMCRSKRTVVSNHLRKAALRSKGALGAVTKLIVTAASQHAKNWGSVPTSAKR